MKNSRKLKIGISCYPTFGGSGVVATEIGMAMAQRGHSVHFICAGVPMRLNRFMDNIFFHEVEVKEYPLFITSQYSLCLTSKMVEVAEYENLDIIHAHYAIPHATSAYLARQILKEKSPKIITTLHGTDITLVGNDRSFLPITRFSILESDGITVPSHYLKHATYDKLNVSSSFPIEIIPNFVDTELYKPKCELPKKELLLPNCLRTRSNEKVIVHISNFRPVKRVLDVVKIFNEVQKTVPSKLFFIGDGPDRSAAEALTKEFNLKDKIIFLGKMDSFTDILKNADLFLLPSENESFGLAALEALSCGIPVVGSKIGGIPEVVADKENGFLHPVGSISEMSMSSIKLLSDSFLWESFSKNARTTVLERYQIDKIIDLYEKFYYSLIR